MAHILVHEFSEMRLRFEELVVRQGLQQLVVEGGNDEVNQASRRWGDGACAACMACAASLGLVGAYY